jgi:ABC-type nitrate/sulfonate/bicarbonate transport system substrate-binding protein
MRFHKRVSSTVLASLIVVGIAVSACSSSGGAPSGSAPSGSASSGGATGGGGSSNLTTLTISEQPYNGLAATALGQKVGIFAHYGLKIELKPASTIAVITAQVQSGQVPLGYTVTAILANAVEKGLGVRCVAPVQGTSGPIPGYPQNAIIVAKDSPITSLKQLNGKKFGLVALVGPNFLAAKQYVTEAGGNWDSVKPAAVPFADMAAAVSSGEVAAGLVVAPFIQKGVASGKVRILKDISANNVGQTVECYMASNSYIDKHKDVIDRFVKAQDQAILYAKAHPEAAAALVPEVAGVPAAALKGKLPPRVNYSTEIKLSSFLAYEKWMKKWGGLNGPLLPAEKLAYIAPGTPMTKLLFDDKGKYIGN